MFLIDITKPKYIILAAIDANPADLATNSLKVSRKYYVHA